MYPCIADDQWALQGSWAMSPCLTDSGAMSHRFMDLFPCEDRCILQPETPCQITHSSLCPRVLQQPLLTKALYV